MILRSDSQTRSPAIAAFCVGIPGMLTASTVLNPTRSGRPRRRLGFEMVECDCIKKSGTRESAARLLHIVSLLSLDTHLGAISNEDGMSVSKGTSNTGEGIRWDPPVWKYGFTEKLTSGTGGLVSDKPVLSSCSLSSAGSSNATTEDACVYGYT